MKPITTYFFSVLIFFSPVFSLCQIIPFEQMFEVSRVDGRGNMGIAIDLTEESELFILNNNAVNKPTYQPGKSPIKVVVGDVNNHALGFFQLKFHGYSGGIANNANWTIYRYSSEAGSLIDSINSESSINVGDEQYIPQWNMYITIEQQNYLVRHGISGPPVFISVPIEATMEFVDNIAEWLTGVKDIDVLSPENWILSGEDYFDNDNFCYSDYTLWDINENFENLLDGIITHFSLLRNCGSVVPISGNSSFNLNTARTSTNTASANSIDLVFTNDKSKWTRSAIVELCQDSQLAQGGAEIAKPRNSASVDKNGYSVGHPNYNSVEGNLVSTHGMGWFPGYAIDVETGRRLNIVFGENSAMPEENGADMIWNPTSTLFDDDGNPKFGGQHVIYVIGENINGSAMPIYDSCQTFFNWTIGSNAVENRNAWKSAMWVMYPLLEEGSELLETDVKIRMRVVKSYENYEITGENEGRPMFEWNLPILLSELYAEYGDEFNGIDEFLNVYPNPTNSSVTVHWEHISSPTLRIFSSQGYVVYETMITEGETFKQLDIEHLNSGLYFVEFGGESRKLILQK